MEHNMDVACRLTSIDVTHHQTNCQIVWGGRSEQDYPASRALPFLLRRGTDQRRATISKQLLNTSFAVVIGKSGVSTIISDEMPQDISEIHHHHARCPGANRRLDLDSKPFH